MVSTTLIVVIVATAAIIWLVTRCPKDGACHDYREIAPRDTAKETFAANELVELRCAKCGKMRKAATYAL